MKWAIVFRKQKTSFTTLFVFNKDFTSFSNFASVLRGMLRENERQGNGGSPTPPYKTYYINQENVRKFS